LHPVKERRRILIVPGGYFRKNSGIYDFINHFSILPFMKKLLLLASLVVVFACSSSDHAEETQKEVEEKQFNRFIMGEWKAYSYTTPISDSPVIIDGCEVEEDDLTEIATRLFQFNDDGTMQWSYTCDLEEVRESNWEIISIDGTDNILHFGGDDVDDNGNHLYRIASMTNEELVLDTKQLTGVTTVYTITLKRP
jgi:hypothetical protein